LKQTTIYFKYTGPCGGVTTEKRFRHLRVLDLDLWPWPWPKCFGVRDRQGTFWSLLEVNQIIPGTVVTKKAEHSMLENFFSNRVIANSKFC